MINTKKLKNIIKYSSFIEIINSGNVIFAKAENKGLCGSGVNNKEEDKKKKF